MKNETYVQNNYTSEGEQNNVYLATGKYISVTGALDDTNIGVTTQKIPAASAEGKADDPDTQEVLIAFPDSSYKDATSSNVCLFSTNFFSDLSYMYTTTGASASANKKAMVMRQNGYRANVSFREEGGSSVVGAPKAYYKLMLGNTAVGDALPALESIDGYILQEVQFSFTDPLTPSSTQMTLTSTQRDADNHLTGKIEGTMPNADVNIVYVFKRNKTRIDFETQGVVTLPSRIGDYGSKTNLQSMIDIPRYGYTHLGWIDDATLKSKYSVYAGSSAPAYTTNDDAVDRLQAYLDADATRYGDGGVWNEWKTQSFPETFQNNDIIYYAIFVPDYDTQFSLSAFYSSTTGVDLGSGV
jgi:hypothetical protein